MGVAIARALGGALCPKDVPGAPDSTVDFMITTDRGDEALEVTSVVDGPGDAFWRAADRRSAQRFDLAQGWVLTVTAQVADVSVVYSKSPAMLRALEAREVSRFDTHDLPRSEAEPWWSIGVRRGHGIAGSEPIIGFSRSTVGVLGPDSPLGLTAEQANKDDNVAKVVNSGGVRRHIGVWIDRSVDSWLGMREGTLPTRRPEIREEIDVLWMGCGLATDDGLHVLWSWDRSTGWVGHFVDSPEKTAEGSRT